MHRTGQQGIEAAPAFKELEELQRRANGLANRGLVADEIPADLPAGEQAARIAAAVCVGCSTLDREQLGSEIERVLRDARRTRRLTRYEDIETFAALDIRLRKLIPAARARGFRIPTHFVAGGVATLCPVAGAIRVRGATGQFLADEHLTVVSQGDLMYALELAKMIPLALPAKAEAGGEDALDLTSIEFDRGVVAGHVGEKASAVSEFARLIQGRLRALSSDYLDSPTLGPSTLRGSIAGGLNGGLLTFILGHELAHVILGHKPIDSEALQLRDVDGEPVAGDYAVLLNAQDQEREADSVGTELLLDIVSAETRPGQVHFGAFGAELLFSWEAVYEAARSEIWGPRARPTIHPPAADRWEQVRRIRERRLGKADPSLDAGETAARLLPLYYRVILPALRANRGRITSDAGTPCRKESFP